MYLVRAARWHMVEIPPTTSTSSAGAPPRRCSACGSGELAPAGTTVMDALTHERYSMVRCYGCGYDLLEPLALGLHAAS